MAGALLTKQDILEHCPHEGIFYRGQKLLRTGAVAAAEENDSMVRARVVRATVQGSAPEPYDVRIEIMGRGRFWSQCTCPHAKTGDLCKHAVAVLLNHAGPAKTAARRRKRPSQRRESRATRVTRAIRKLEPTVARALFVETVEKRLALVESLVESPLLDIKTTYWREPGKRRGKARTLYVYMPEVVIDWLHTLRKLKRKEKVDPVERVDGFGTAGLLAFHADMHRSFLSLRRHKRPEGDLWTRESIIRQHRLLARQLERRGIRHPDPGTARCKELDRLCRATARQARRGK